MKNVQIVKLSNGKFKEYVFYISYLLGGKFSNSIFGENTLKWSNFKISKIFSWLGKFYSVLRGGGWREIIHFMQNI